MVMQLCENSRMPRVVDHEQRRSELAGAVRRVVAGHGVEGATVRAVAAEAGWSMGALRYYFMSQDDLLDFALDTMLAEVPVRVQQVLAAEEPGLDRAQAVLEQLLPLDDARLAEVRVYLAFMARVRTRDARRDVVELAWAGERHVCALAVADVTGQDPPEELGTVPPHLVEAVDDLQVFVDGLTFLGATVPGRLGPTRARALLRARLQALVAPSG